MEPRARTTVCDVCVWQIKIFPPVCFRDSWKGEEFRVRRARKHQFDLNFPVFGVRKPRQVVEVLVIIKCDNKRFSRAGRTRQTIVDEGCVRWRRSSRRGERKYLEVLIGNRFGFGKRKSHLISILNLKSEKSLNSLLAPTSTESHSELLIQHA